jgi:hypothetical protein
VVASRSLLDVSAVPDEGFRPRRAGDGRAVSAYSVALQNHARAPVTVALAVRAAPAEVEVRPDRVALGPLERRQVRVVASARGLPPGRSQAELSVESRRGDEVVARRSERLPISAPPEAP